MNACRFSDRANRCLAECSHPSLALSGAILCLLYLFFRPAQQRPKWIQVSPPRPLLDFLEILDSRPRPFSLARIKTQSSTRGRPNTQFPFGSIKSDAILCCGEDPGEFKAAIGAVFGPPRPVHAYRCYALFEAREITFIWTGIGTGCIEPLLCEIHDEPDLRRILLVGTAGSVANRAQLGVATPIRQAAISCAGISPKSKRLRPNWPTLPIASTQTIVSTDYYYGFTLRKNFPTPKLWAADTRLRKAVARALSRVDLVDMETGQFYHLCRVLRPDWRYLAIKGAANPLNDFSQQTLHSESVLHDALRQAKIFLAR